MKRQSDVIELLGEANRLIVDVEKTYEKSKNSETIDVISRPKVKSCFEHLRSVLDYVAQDLYETIDSARKSNRDSVYFPYGKNAETYQQKLKQNLSGLDSKYLPILESLQPHVCGDDWLIQLCRATNLNKHRQLQNQERRNSPESEINIGNVIRIGSGCNNIVIENCFVNGIPIARSQRIEVTKGKPIAEIRKEVTDAIPVCQEYEWVEFILTDCNIDVLELLKKSYNNINRFVDKIYSV